MERRSVLRDRAPDRPGASPPDDEPRRPGRSGPARGQDQKFRLHREKYQSALRGGVGADSADGARVHDRLQNSRIERGRREYETFDFAAARSRSAVS